MFEDLTRPSRDELEKTLSDRQHIITDLENELVDRVREIRDADKRNGEYIEMLDNMRDLIQIYFDEHGRNLFEEWEKEEKDNFDTSCQNYNLTNFTDTMCILQAF